MAASATSLVLLLLLVAGGEAVASSSNAPPAPAVVVGGRTEIRDVGSNREVQSLGRFAVAEHNRRLRHHGGAGAGSTADPVAVKLAFVSVVAAQKQVVSGVAYYLKVVAREAHAGAGAGRPFDAVVVVKPWLKSKELVSFAPSPK
ncbi:cysteine proteinase inhibitor 10-like [Oryza brachyantha]|uniref:cysteine proteinase inhibitor 10-like n=1 Tax=Oryza brachyantha TaxID=4533 RepID=UPI001ADD1656|nr:cysteine proteinase inhibitor 10-like [Oryza brachyantha]